MTPMIPYFFMSDGRGPIVKDRGYVIERCGWKGRVAYNPLLLMHPCLNEGEDSGRITMYANVELCI